LNTPPKAKQIPKKLVKHNDERIDEFYWLNERDNPEVKAYLEAENNYYKEETKHLNRFTDDLFAEMKSRIKEDDESVPYFLNEYWYQAKFETGKDYPIYVRKLVKFFLLKLKKQPEVLAGLMTIKPYFTLEKIRKH